MQIVLMRHGMPSLDLDAILKQKVSPKKLAQIIADYEVAELAPDTQPDKDAQNIASKCQSVFSSDLSRATQSLQRLGLQDKATVDPVFAESTMPHLKWGWPRMSLFKWFVIFRILWLARFGKNGENITAATERAQICSDKIRAKAAMHGPVLVVGHGIMNRLIARDLEARGWVKNEANGNGYWSFMVFSK